MVLFMKIVSLLSHYLVQDEDTDDELVYSLSELPDGAKFDEKSGSFSWTPNYNQGR